MTCHFLVILLDIKCYLLVCFSNMHVVSLQSIYVHLNKSIYVARPKIGGRVQTMKIKLIYDYNYFDRHNLVQHLYFVFTNCVL